MWYVVLVLECSMYVVTCAIVTYYSLIVLMLLWNVM